MATTNMVRINTKATSPARQTASRFGTRPAPASLALMSSTNMNIVDTRPSNVVRKKRVLNQQGP